MDAQGEPLKINILAMSELSRIGELVKEFLENTGFTVDLQSMERSVMEERIKKWDYDLAITRHGAIGGDPGSLVMFMVGEVRPHLLWISRSGLKGWQMKMIFVYETT